MLCAYRPPIPPVASTTRDRLDHQRLLAARGEHAGHCAGGIGEDAAGLDAVEHQDRRAGPHRGDHGAHDLATGGVSLRMDDTAARMRRLQAELQRAGGVAVEAGSAASTRSAIAAGASREDAGGSGGVTETVAGGERVGDVQRGLVVGSDAGGDAALRPGGGRLRAQRRGGQYHHGGRGHVQRAHQPGEAGPDDHRAPGQIGQNRHHFTASMRSTARRARSATDGSIVTSCVMVSSECGCCRA